MKTTLGRGVLVGCVAGLLGATGCALGPNKDADRFRQAIPSSDDVEVPGPESGGGSTASADGLTGVASHGEEDEWWASGPWAKYYGFTRAIRGEVNGITAAILGSAWLIVHSEATSVSEDEAVWGPHTDALSPVTWRFRVTEVAPLEYDYVLEGRPKKETSDDAYRAVLSGKGYGERHPEHGDGYFQIDLDSAAELDPFSHHDDTGVVRITHALSSWPAAVVKAEVTPTGSKAWWNVTSSRNPDGSGELVVDAHDDVDDHGNTQLEDITIASQWRPAGAGRADITLTGGDLPIDEVTAVECWDSDFYRTYYGDSVDHEAREGDAAQCAFEGVSF